MGTHFTVITDHSSLLWLHNLKDPTGRLARWATALQAYDMDIIHRKGSLHKVPDALSRSLDAGEHIAALDTTPNTFDTWYMEKLNKVRENPANYPDFKLHNNVLYIHRPNRTTDPILSDLNRWKIMVPLPARKQIIYEAHNIPESGHFGSKKTINRKTFVIIFLAYNA